MHKPVETESRLEGSWTRKDKDVGDNGKITAGDKCQKNVLKWWNGYIILWLYYTLPIYFVWIEWHRNVVSATGANNIPQQIFAPTTLTQFESYGWCHWAQECESILSQGSYLLEQELKPTVYQADAQDNVLPVACEVQQDKREEQGCASFMGHRVVPEYPMAAQSCVIHTHTGHIHTWVLSTQLEQ